MAKKTSLTSEDLNIGYPIADIEGIPDDALALSDRERIALQKVTDWFTRDELAKQPFLDEWDELYKLYNGNHWDMTGPDGNQLRDDKEKENRPNAAENMAAQLIRSTAAEFAVPAELVDYPVEEADEDAAYLLSQVKEAVAYKNRISDQKNKYLLWLFLYGSTCEATTWDSNWRGGSGPNRWEGDCRWTAMHPAMLVPDGRCGEDINRGYRCHTKEWVPIEKIYEDFPDYARAVQPDTVDGSGLLDMDSDETWTSAEGREGQVLLVTTWYKGRPLVLGKGEKEQGDGLHVIFHAEGGQNVYLGHENYLYYNPGETVKFPFHVKTCYYRENCVWGYGYGHVLKNPQILQNKAIEIAMEGHMHQVFGKTFYDPDKVDEDTANDLEAYGTLPGMNYAIQDPEHAVKVVYGQGVPGSLLNDIARRPKVMEAIVQRFDISQGRTPGNIVAFQALQLLAQRAQVGLRTAEETIKSGYEEAGAYLNRLICRYYTGRRLFRIIGKTEYDKATYGVYDPNSLKKVWLKGQPTVTVLPFSEFNPEALRKQDEGGNPVPLVEGEDYEIFSPDFDTRCRMSSALPTDRLFYMEMAKELYAANAIDKKTFFYVIERGKFPPWEELEAEAAKQAQMAAARGMPQLPPGGPQPAQAGPVGANASSVSPAPKRAPAGAMEWEKGAPDDGQAMQNFLSLLSPDQQKEFMALSDRDKVALLSAAAGEGQAQGA